MPRTTESATLHLELRGVDLTNTKGWFGTSSPSYKVCAFSLGTSDLWTKVAQSERMDQDLDPLWPSLQISCQDLCGCDLDRPIQIAVFDSEKSGNELDPMGAFETTVSALLKKKIEDLNNVDVAKLFTLQEAGKDVGKIAVMNAWVEEPPVEKFKKAVGNVQMVSQLKNLAELPPSPPSDDESDNTQSPVLDLKLRGINIEFSGKGLIRGKTNPMYKLSAFRMGQASPFEVVFESHVLEDDINPKWEVSSINMEDLCSNNKDLPIMISIVNHDGAKEVLIGCCETTVADLIRNQVGDTDNVESSKIFKIKDGTKERGVIVVVEANIQGSDSPTTKDPPFKAAPQEVIRSKQSEETNKKSSKALSGKENEREGERDNPLNEGSILHLTLAGVDMANVEGWFGCSDPFFQIEGCMKGFDGKILWQNVLRSEHIENSLNPQWDPVKINLDLLCQLDLNKPIRIFFFDFEESGKHNPMGFFETTVSGLLQAKAEQLGDSWDMSKAFTTKAEDGEEFGRIVVADALIETPKASRSRRSNKPKVPLNVNENSILRVTLEGVDMANVEGWFGCSDPFFQVETPMKGPEGKLMWQSVFRSEHILDTLNPVWEPAEISIDLLCQCDLDKPIRFSFFDWEESGRHNEMGSFETSVNRLLRSKSEKQGNQWDLSKAFITKADDGEEFGKIVVVDVTVETRSKSTHVERDAKKLGAATVNKNSTLVLSLEGVDMINVDGWFGCSDPFFEVEKPVFHPEGFTTWEKIYRSMQIEDDANPKWEPAVLGLQMLCECDLDRPIRIHFFDWEESLEHQAMGHFETTVNRLLRSKAEKKGDKWDLSKAFITKTDDGEEFGRIVVADISVEKGASRADRAARQSFVSRDRGLRRGMRSNDSKSNGSHSSARSTSRDSSVPSSAKGNSISSIKRSTSLSKAKHANAVRDKPILELTVEGVNLANVEGWFGCSDPFYQIDVNMGDGDEDADWLTFFKSEHLEDTLNPRWKPLLIDLGLLCELDIDQPIRVSVFDWEESGDHNPMGHFNTTVRGILEASCDGGGVGNGKPFVLFESGQEFGEIYIVDARLQRRQLQSKLKFDYLDGNSMLQLELEGVEMKNVEGWFGCSDPFFKVESSAHVPNGSVLFQTVYISEHLVDTLNPKWKPAWINLEMLCELNFDRLIRVSIFDWEENGQHVAMGSFLTSVNGLLCAVAKKGSDGIDAARAFQSYQDGKDFGKIIVVSATIEASDSNRESVLGSSEHASSRSFGGRSYSQEASSHSSDSRRSGNISGGRYSDDSGSRRRMSLSPSRRRPSSEDSRSSYGTRRSDSYQSGRSGRSGSSFSSDYSRSLSGRRYSDDGGSYDSRSHSLSKSARSQEFLSDRSGRSFDSQQSSRDRSQRSGDSRYSDDFSRESGGSHYSDEFTNRSRGSRLLAEDGSKRSQDSRYSDELSRRSGDSRSFSSKLSRYSDEIENSNLSARSKNSGRSIDRSYGSAGNKTQDSGHPSVGKESHDSGGYSDRSWGSRSDSEGRFSDRQSYGSIRAGSRSSRRSRSSSGSRQSYSTRSGRYHSDGSQSRSRSRSLSRSRTSYSSRGSRSLSSRSFDSRSRSDYSKRSNDSRFSRRSGSLSQSEGSYSKRSRRSYSDRSRSPLSYSSRSRSWSPSRRSYSSRSRYSDYSRSESHSRRSGASDDAGGALKLSTWEELQNQANEDEVAKADLKFYLTIKGIKLSNVRGWFGKTSPYFQVSAHCVGTSHVWQPVYTSEAIEGDLNPQWRPASIGLGLLCDGNHDKKIRISVVDQDKKTGKQFPMGSFETTVNKLVEAKVGGFGSDDNFDEAKTFLLKEDGKVMGRIVVLSAHADVQQERPVVLKDGPSQIDSRGYGDRSDGSFSRRSRSSRRSLRSGSHRSTSRRSRRSWSSRSRSSRSRSSRSLSRSRSSAGSSRRSFRSYSDDSVRSPAGMSDASASVYASSASSSDSDSEVAEENAFHEDATIQLTLFGSDLANVEGFFGTSDPFIQIAAYMGVPGALMWQPIFRSEHVEDSLNPRWKPMDLNLELLCKRNLDHPIQISIFDWEETGKHQPMGSFETTVNGLIEARVICDEDGELDTSRAFTVMHEGEYYGKIVVATATIDNPMAPMKIARPGRMKKKSKDPNLKQEKKPKKKPKKQKQHQVKFNTHGDELSIGTIESDIEEQLLEKPGNVFGDEEDDGKSRPWKEALPTNTGLDIDEEIGNFAIGEGGDDDGDSEASITNIAEILQRVEADSDSDSDDSDDDEEDDDDDDDDDDEDDDDATDKEGSEHSKEDEHEAMLDMMSSMQKSLSYMAGAPQKEDDEEIDLEKFDEMYETVVVDQKVVAEFERKFEERARKGKKKDGEENDDPDLLRDTPRLILFESEKDSKKRRRGKRKKKDEAKFSKEFLAAMRLVFSDSDDESDMSDEEVIEKKEDHDIMSRGLASFSKRNSEASLFVGGESKKELRSDDEQGEAAEKTDDGESKATGEDDDLDKSKKSLASAAQKLPPKKKIARKRKKPQIDPAEIFAEEMRRQEGMKIMSIDGLKQEMADMKKGLTRKMMERELANLRKATSNKFSPFDSKAKQPGLFEDYNPSSKPYGGSAPAKTAPKPKGGGLMSHLAKNEESKDEEAKKLDDLATVALVDKGDGAHQLAELTNISALGAIPVQPKADAAKKASSSGVAGMGEQPFFAAQNAWDDDESQANVGLTNKGSETGAARPGGGLAKRQSVRPKFAAPTMFAFGKKKTGAGVQLGDDDY